MPVARVGDIDIHYEIDGQGPPLLLIMGLGGQASSWGDDLLSLLAAHFQVIRFDNRGCGLSDKPEAGYTIATMADDAGGLLEAIGCQRAHVFGISMGGMIAQELALRHPQRLHGLVLGCTACSWINGVGPAPEVVALMVPAPGLDPEEQVRRAWPAIASQEFIDSAEGHDFLERMLAKSLENPTPMETLMRQAAAVQAFESFERLPEIQAPTLIIGGDRDLLIPPQNSHILRERIPNSRLAVIPGAGHVFFWEQPKETAEKVVRFLSAVPASA
jgi:pimeloyl-ACP methyl ester carboxylesterase